MAEHICVTLVPLFNQLSEQEQLAINQLATHHHYKKDELIFQPGDEKLVIVARGDMKVYQLSPNGKEQLLRVVEPGGYEGENQLFGIENDTLFGQAIVDTDICSLSKKAFNQILLNTPELSLRLFELSAQKMLQVEKQAQFLSMERIEERLATYLLDLVKVTDSPEVRLSMKMKDLALYLGTTPETLSRKFKAMEETGYISRKGRNITILDEEGLEDL